MLEFREINIDDRDWINKFLILWDVNTVLPIIWHGAE